VFRQTRTAFLQHENAKAELKGLMPEDAKEAVGHGLRAKRSKSGAINFDLLALEEHHAARLLDPNAAPIRTAPGEERHLFVAAANGHLPTICRTSQPGFRGSKVSENSAGPPRRGAFSSGAAVLVGHNFRLLLRLLKLWLPSRIDHFQEFCAKHIAVLWAEQRPVRALNGNDCQVPT
jgi:hypothetical protein